MASRRIFGHGVDIANVTRFVPLIEKYGDRFLRKALHPVEIKHFTDLKDLKLKSNFLASRWALKEAVIKASGKRLLFPEMYLRPGNMIDPRPTLTVEGAAKDYFDSLQLTSFVSISHDGDYTIASVILESTKPQEDPQTDASQT